MNIDSVKTVDYTNEVLEMRYGQISWLSDLKSEWCKKMFNFFSVSYFIQHCIEKILFSFQKIQWSAWDELIKRF